MLEKRKNTGELLITIEKFTNDRKRNTINNDVLLALIENELRRSRELKIVSSI